MYKTCSHCRRNVLPKGDGTCPGCGRSDALREYVPKPSVLLEGEAVFPPICAFCGTAAAESKVLTWRRPSPHADHSAPMRGILAVIITQLLNRTSGRLDQVISFRLPHCHDCRAMELEVIAIHWDDYRVEACCHEAFREAISAAKGKGPISGKE